MAVRQRSKHELVTALQTRYGRLIGLARPGCSTSSARRRATTASTRSGYCGRGRRHPGLGMVAAPACTQQWSLARCACAPKPAAGCAASAWLPFWPNWYPPWKRRCAPSGAAGAQPTAGDERCHHRPPLATVRLQLVRGFGATKPGSLLKSQVPIRTWTPWDEQRVGFLEIDLVAHCGITNAGQFCTRWWRRTWPAVGPSAWAYPASARTTCSSHSKRSGPTAVRLAGTRLR